MSAPGQPRPWPHRRTPTGERALNTPFGRVTARPPRLRLNGEDRWHRAPVTASSTMMWIRWLRELIRLARADRQSCLLHPAARGGAPRRGHPPLQRCVDHLLQSARAVLEALLAGVSDPRSREDQLKIPQLREALARRRPGSRATGHGRAAARTHRHARRRDRRPQQADRRRPRPAPASWSICLRSSGPGASRTRRLGCALGSAKSSLRPPTESEAALGLEVLSTDDSVQLRERSDRRSRRSAWTRSRRLSARRVARRRSSVVV
jgi:hypothetical protein